MNQEQIKGEFEQLKGAAKQLWAGLKDEDFRDATEEKILGRVTELYGITKAEAQSKLQSARDQIKAAGKNSSGKGAIAENIHKAADKFNEFTVQGQRKVDNLADTLSEYAEQSQQKIEGAAQVAKQQGQELYDSAEKYMKAKPMTACLIALGVGALLGAIISR